MERNIIHLPLHKSNYDHKLNDHIENFAIIIQLTVSIYDSTKSCINTCF